MDATLVMFKSDGTRRDFPLDGDRVVIGRKSGCDLRIPLASVSRDHCELLIDHEDETIRVRDLGSSNGTYHNQQRIQEAQLAPGDELNVGPVIFVVQVAGQPADIEPVRTMVDSEFGHSYTQRGSSQQTSSGDSSQTAAAHFKDIDDLALNELDKDDDELS